MNEQQIHQQTEADNDFIKEFLPIIKKVWNSRRTVIFSVIAGTILGVIFALLSPNEYTVSTVMVPQVGGDSKSKLGGLGGLAALAGISLDFSQDADISPIIYPQVVSSVPFTLEIMNTPLNFENYPQAISLYDYYINNDHFNPFATVKKYTVGLPGLLIKAIKGKKEIIVLPKGNEKQPISLTNNQFTVKKAIENMLSLDVNAKQGYLTLTVTMPEALAAAQLAQKSMDLLQKYITEFKIEKAKTNLDFIQGRCDETKAEFEKAQVSLALVNDRSKNFTSGLSQIETDRIQTKYNIAFNVYQELAKQLEQAKIQVKKQTPIYTIIEPVTVPSEKSSKSKIFILVSWMFFGGIIGLGIIFGKRYWADLKKNWKEI